MSYDFVDVTILGGGPVGLFAAFYAGLRGMSVRIVDSLSELGGQLVALYPEKYVYDMPGFPKILAKDLASEMIKQGSQFHPEIVLDETAETLETIGESLMLVTQSGVELPTKTLIIAAGAGAFSPTRIGVDRESEFEGKGIYYGVKSLSDFSGKRIGIVGGGDSAFDWCMALEPIANSIALIHRRDQFRAHEDSVRKVKESNVEMRLWNVVKELHGTELLSAISLENVESKEVEKIELDALIVNVGFKSSLGPLKNWNLEFEKNQIKVKPTTMETNIPGVFAIGDVAGFEGKLKLIANGVGEAVTAVCNAKQKLDPQSKLFPGHSSDRDL
jgi:thioredoxin reductase (NADPH)